jgi:hypothetical protein
MKTYKEKSIKELVLDRRKLSRISCPDICYVDICYGEELLDRTNSLHIDNIVGKLYKVTSGNKVIYYTCLSYDSRYGLTKFRSVTVIRDKYNVVTEVIDKEISRYVTGFKKVYCRGEEKEPVVRNDIFILEGNHELQLVNIDSYFDFPKEFLNINKSGQRYIMFEFSSNIGAKSNIMTYIGVSIGKIYGKFFRIYTKKRGHYKIKQLPVDILVDLSDIKCVGKDANAIFMKENTNRTITRFTKFDVDGSLYDFLDAQLVIIRNLA